MSNNCMDAKNIFIACKRHSVHVNWAKINSNEWNYIGVGSDYDISKVIDLILHFFGESEIYLVINRHHAFPVDTKIAAQSIKELLIKDDLLLSNKDFSKMIMFNKIGVVKYGVRPPIAHNSTRNH